MISLHNTKPKIKNQMKTPFETYATRKDALAEKSRLESGTYYLAHGEYERPILKVRKLRGKDQYYINVQYFYCPGTFFARKNGPLFAH
jgi:hypothetical protein